MELSLPHLKIYNKNTFFLWDNFGLTFFRWSGTPHKKELMSKDFFKGKGIRTLEVNEDMFSSKLAQDKLLANLKHKDCVVDTLVVFSERREGPTHSIIESFEWGTLTLLEVVFGPREDLKSKAIHIRFLRSFFCFSLEKIFDGCINFIKEKDLVSVKTICRNDGWSYFNCGELEIPGTFVCDQLFEVLSTRRSLRFVDFSRGLDGTVSFQFLCRLIACPDFFLCSISFGDICLDANKFSVLYASIVANTSLSMICFKSLEIKDPCLEQALSYLLGKKNIHWHYL